MGPYDSWGLTGPSQGVRTPRHCLLLSALDHVVMNLRGPSAPVEVRAQGEDNDGIIFPMNLPESHGYCVPQLLLFGSDMLLFLTTMTLHFWTSLSSSLLRLSYSHPILSTAGLNFGSWLRLAFFISHSSLCLIPRFHLMTFLWEKGFCKCCLLLGNKVCSF